MSNNPHISMTITCAAPNCGKQKGTNNHWFLARVYPSRFVVDSWNDLTLSVDNDSVLPLCSDQCAVRMLSMFLSDQKSKAQAQGGPLQ